MMVSLHVCVRDGEGEREGERVSDCVAQAGLELSDLPALAFLVLDSQAYTTIVSNHFRFQMKMQSTEVTLPRTCQGIKKNQLGS